MYYMVTKRKYRKIGRNFVNKLRLKTHPLAIKLLEPGEKPPIFAPMFDEIFDQKDMASSLMFTHFRRLDASVTIRKENISDKTASLNLGFEKLTNKDAFYKTMEASGGFKRDANAEKKSFEATPCFEPAMYESMVISPLPLTFVTPDVVLVFGQPVALSLLILAATYDGTNIESSFYGTASVISEGIVRAMQTNKCQVINPSPDERAVAAIQDDEMVFAIPGSLLSMVDKNLLKAGNILARPGRSPFSFPYATPNWGNIKIKGKTPAPELWHQLNQIILQNREVR